MPNHFCWVLVVVLSHRDVKFITWKTGRSHNNLPQGIVTFTIVGKNNRIRQAVIQALVALTICMPSKDNEYLDKKIE